MLTVSYVQETELTVSASEILWIYDGRKTPLTGLYFGESESQSMISGMNDACEIQPKYKGVKNKGHDVWAGSS